MQAQVLYLSRESVPDPLYHLITFRYRRCVHLLAKNKLTQTHIQARFLAGQSLVESKQWDECINLLGDEPEPESKNADETKVPRALFNRSQL